MEHLNKSSLNATAFYCHYCSKEYKTKTKLDKHVSLCEIIYKTNHNQKVVVEEEEELPSQKQMYQILLELGQKYNRLEQKVDEMSKWVMKKKKKVNAIEWLNTNITPEMTFAHLHERMEVTEQDVEYLFANTFLDTLNVVFARMMDTFEEVNNKPIFAFEHKGGVFYVFEEEEPIPSNNETPCNNVISCKKGWILLTREKLTLFLNRCHRKISKALSDWKKNNGQKMDNDDKCTMLYDKTMSKLMGVEMKKDATFNKVKNMLFHYLKTDVKVLIEYEFEF
jgi:uncharacterized protein YeeX (DUF496 family)